MADFALNADGDLDVVAGRIRKLTGTDAVQQRLKTRLQLFKGDWFRNLLSGIPYHEQIFPKRARPTVRREVFRRAIATMRGISGVPQIALTIDAGARKLSVRGQATLDDGTALDFSLNPPVFDFGTAPSEDEAT